MFATQWFSLRGADGHLPRANGQSADNGEGCQLGVGVVLGGVLEVSLTFPRRLANRHMDGGALKVKFMLPRRSQTIIYVNFFTRPLAGRYLAIVSSSPIACKSCPIAEVFEAGY